MRICDPRGIWIKVDGVTREQDVDAAVEAGVSAVGMIFVLSPRHITFGRAAKLRARIPDGVTAFGVFDGQSPGAVHRAVRGLNLGGIQIPAEADIDRPGYPGLDPDVLVLRTVRVRGPQELEDLSALQADAVHIDAYVPGRLGGTGHTAPWDDIADNPPRRTWVLSGGLTPENVAAAIGRLGPDGVDVSSGVEAGEPGIKDARRLAAFVKAARRVSR